jgi:hypothetical protein
VLESSPTRSRPSGLFRLPSSMMRTQEGERKRRSETSRSVFARTEGMMEGAPDLCKNDSPSLPAEAYVLRKDGDEETSKCLIPNLRGTDPTPITVTNQP